MLETIKPCSWVSQQSHMPIVKHFVVAVVVVVGRLLNVPTTCCMLYLKDDLLRQLNVLPLWDRSCWSNVISPSDRILTPGQPAQALIPKIQASGRYPLEYQYLSPWYDSTWRKSSRGKQGSIPGLPPSRRTPYHQAAEAVEGFSMSEEMLTSTQARGRCTVP